VPSLATAADGAAGSGADAGLKVVYVIRHGEKQFDPANHTAFDYACLSEKGWARAYNLKSVFGPRPMPPFRTPDALFSANYGNDIDCRDAHGFYRTQATLAPLAAASPGGLGLLIDNTTGWLADLCAREERDESCVHDSTPGAEPHDFGTCCNAAAARAILAKLAEPQIRSVLVCWEHLNIQYLVAALGATAVLPRWPHTEFDRVYALYYRPYGGFVRIDTFLRQGFTADDADYLGPVVGCGAVAPRHFANSHLPSRNPAA
jgi:hypothetical protein